MRDELTEARLRLAMAGGLGPTLTRRLLEQFGDAVAASHASARELRQVEGIGQKNAARIRMELDEADVERELALIAEHGATLVAIDDEAYPLLLKHIHDPPPLLYVRGAFDRSDSIALGVVGSRKCTAYGREQAERLAAACAQAGMAIVSGGARGIDTASHRAALRMRGRTIAVLGCGLGQCYPPENRELFEAIAAQGAVISELPMTAPPIADNFPRRNRLISGLALGILVVEAAIRSGALITARLASEDHNREVMAVPGRVDSQASAGCHKIIREGWAALVTNAADIMDALGETGQLLRGAMDADDRSRQAASGEGEQLTLDHAGMDDAQRKLIDAITLEPIDIDTLARRTALPVGAIHGHLTMFELRGLTERLAGNKVRRRRRS